MKTSETFERLARDTSSLAAAVRCSPAEYRDGLRTIIEQLQTDIRASEETDPES